MQYLPNTQVGGFKVGTTYHPIIIAQFNRKLSGLRHYSNYNTTENKTCRILYVMRPNLAKLRVFGCIAYLHLPQETIGTFESRIRNWLQTDVYRCGVPLHEMNIANPQRFGYIIMRGRYTIRKLCYLEDYSTILALNAELLVENIPQTKNLR